MKKNKSKARGASRASSSCVHVRSDSSSGGRTPKKRILDRQQRSDSVRSLHDSVASLQQQVDLLSLSNFMELQLEYEKRQGEGKRVTKKLILDKQKQKQNKDYSASRRNSISSRRGSMASRRGSISNCSLPRSGSIPSRRGSIPSRRGSMSSYQEGSICSSFYRETTTVELVNGKFCIRKKRRLKTATNQADINDLIITVDSNHKTSSKSFSYHEENSDESGVNGESQELKSSELVKGDYEGNGDANDSGEITEQELERQKSIHNSNNNQYSCEEKKEEDGMKRRESKRWRRKRKKERLRRQRSQGNDSVTTGDCTVNSKEDKKEAMRRRAEKRKKRVLEIIDKILQETKENDKIDSDAMKKDDPKSCRRSSETSLIHSVNGAEEMNTRRLKTAH